ncbi:hypothetical protein JIN77_02645 [Verrucomicrobiaceae bacterium R5-34]|nr:hypothetical protein [Verrucomicrobiaceae bacterium R5-34]
MPQFSPNRSLFPISEHTKLEQLENLFQNWHQAITEKEPELADALVFDGFYPHYSSQKKRILFVGREPRDLTGHHYIETLHRAYTICRRIGEKPLNQAQFHSLQFYLCHGILNQFPEYDGIPWAEELSETFADASGWSYAFMNLSKVSNDTDDWSTNWGESNRFLEASTNDRNFLKEQIEIINPELIITMNLGERLDYLGEIDQKSKVHTGNVTSWKYITGDKSIPLLDTWHFSAPSKSPKTHFYNPLREALK